MLTHFIDFISQPEEILERLRLVFKVTKQHGEFIEKNGVLMMGTFHPAALLRNPNNKPQALEDFLRLRDKINELCEHTY